MGLSQQIKGRNPTVPAFVRVIYADCHCRGGRLCPPDGQPQICAEHCRGRRLCRPKNVANSPKIFVKTLHSAGGQSRPPLRRDRKVLTDSPQISEGIHCILPGGAEPRPYQGCAYLSAHNSYIRMIVSAISRFLTQRSIAAFSIQRCASCSVMPSWRMRRPFAFWMRLRS